MSILENRFLKGLVLIFILSSLILSPAVTTAHAAETVNVPAYMELDAATLDVTVSEKITMINDGKSEVMEVSDLQVTNNATAFRVKITEIDLFPIADNWEITYDSENFKSMPANSKMFSLVADGIDLCDAPIALTDRIVGAGATETIVLTGKTCASTVSLSDIQVLNLILTISMEESFPRIAFTIGQGPHTALEGMTWAEWVESEYNTGISVMGSTRTIGISSDGTKIVSDSDSTWLRHGTTDVAPSDIIIAGVDYSLYDN